MIFFTAIKKKSLYTCLDFFIDSKKFTLVDAGLIEEARLLWFPNSVWEQIMTAPDVHFIIQDGLNLF
jgi:hypothetical protein